MANKSIVVESRTLLARWATRMDIAAARVVVSVEDLTRTEGALASGETLSYGSGTGKITKFVELTVDSPILVKLITSDTPAGLVIPVSDHILLTTTLASLELISPNVDGDGKPDIAFRLVFA